MNSHSDQATRDGWSENQMRQTPFHESTTSEASLQKGTPGQAVGRHVLLDLYGVRDPRLRNAGELTELLTLILSRCGFRQLGARSHQFPGESAGATAMILLSESHAAIHTYPEREYAAIDIFSCGDADVERFVAEMTEALHPQRYTRRDHLRGEAADE